MSSEASAPSALSPSRAADFKNCPLLYRLRAVDRIPEPVTTAQVKGTLVHAVLERLFEQEAAERTRTAAISLVAGEWSRLREGEPGADGLFSEEAAEKAWLMEAEALVDSYFHVEDPTRLPSSERESLVEATVGDGVRLRGYIDRLDVAPTGEIRVVDYKTGRSPREAFVAQALFQLKFYALLLWRTRGEIPRVLRLLYLGDREIIDYSPDEYELRAMERTVIALWRAITKAVETGDFRPRKNALCGWCAHQRLCPEFGGTPPPYPLTTVSTP